MKRLITLLALVSMIATASAMSYSQAREQALFLTDKMAYELRLTDTQSNAAYEINLDYIMNINVAGDLFGTYWNRRNTELSYVLTAAQYRTFTATSYFYRPITWTSHKFHFVIYDRYDKGRLYGSIPSGYHTYKGGNRHNDTSPYRGDTHDTYGKGKVHNNGKTTTPPTRVNPGGGSARKPNTGTTAKRQSANEGKSMTNNRRH